MLSDCVRYCPVIIRLLSGLMHAIIVNFIVLMTSGFIMIVSLSLDLVHIISTCPNYSRESFCEKREW